MLTYTIEKFCDHIEELKELSELHYKESRPYDDIPLNVDWNSFIKLEEISDQLKFYAMKKNGKLIAYMIFFVGPSLEYSTSLQASLSNIFLHPDHRGYGLKFIKWCDEQLKILGVQVVYHHVKTNNDYGLLLKRIGYVSMNIEYARRLDK